MHHDWYLQASSSAEGQPVAGLLVRSAVIHVALGGLLVRCRHRRCLPCTGLDVLLAASTCGCCDQHGQQVCANLTVRVLFKVHYKYGGVCAWRCAGETCVAIGCGAQLLGSVPQLLLA